MPLRLALALTAAINFEGRRMLIWASFAWNSKRAGLNCEKSSPDKSFSRKASASASVLSFGTCFIGSDLLFVHVAGADGTNEYSALVIAEGEGNEERSSRLILSNRDEPLLGSGMLHVGRHLWSCHECRLNIRQRHAVFAALANIAIVPIAACDLLGH